MSKKWAILIGINGYHQSLGALKFCINDVGLVYETLVSECCGFSPDNIVILTDDQSDDQKPRYGNIHSYLGPWLGGPGEDDIVLVYFAGHGREVNDKSLLVPLDATLDTLSHTGIPILEIQDQLKNCKAKQKVLILDACHSGGGRDVVTMTTGFRKDLNSGQGIFTIASCDIDQRSYPWKEKRHGIFTYFLAEAIREQAPVGKDGMLSLDSVYEWTRKAVVDWSSARLSVQEPVRECQVKGDIYIAKRKNKIGKDQAVRNQPTVKKCSSVNWYPAALSWSENQASLKIRQEKAESEQAMMSSNTRSEAVVTTATGPMPSDVCPKCDNAVERGWTACSKCGESLSRRCGFCKLDLPLDSHYCPACSRPVDATAVEEYVLAEIEKCVSQGEAHLKLSKAGQEKLKAIMESHSRVAEGTRQERITATTILWTSIYGALGEFLPVITLGDWASEEASATWTVMADGILNSMKAMTLMTTQLAGRSKARLYLLDQQEQVEHQLKNYPKWMKPSFVRLNNWIEVSLAELERGGSA